MFQFLLQKGTFYWEFCQKKQQPFSCCLFYGRGDRARVSGGHLCAQHRSTDRGDSRDLEPAASSLLRFPKSHFGLERRAILTTAPLTPRFIIHWTRFGDNAQSRRACFVRRKKKTATFRLLSFLWSRRQDLNLRHPAPKAGTLPN